MTDRKPDGESVDSWVERQTREAEAKGTFDDLPGTGKPIPDLDRPYDPMWWAKEKLRREGISMLPDGLRLKREVEQELECILSLFSEAKVRAAVDALNARIRTVNASITSGPPSNVVPLNVERVLARWWDARPA